MPTMPNAYCGQRLLFQTLIKYYITILANYIQAETWIYFDALKKDVQIKIIEHLLHIVHGKYDDYRGRVASIAPILFCLIYKKTI